MQQDRTGRRGPGKAGLILIAVIATTLAGPVPALGGSARKILFVRYERDRSNLFSINPDGTGLIRLTNVVAWESDAALSPDGSRVAFSRCRQRCNILVANVEGTGVTRLTNGPQNEQFPAWSPDGTKIAFSRGADPRGGAALYVMDADGMNQTALTTDRWFNAFPSWSPDGTQMVFVRFLGGDYELYRIAADGSEKARLTNNEGVDLDPQWSPDGSHIVFSHQPAPDTDYELFAMTPDGADVRRLTRNDFKDDFVPKWSPASDRIAFVRCHGSTCDLLTMNSNGSAKTKLVDGGVESLSFAWDAGGTDLALARLNQRDRFDVFTVDDDASNLTNITRTRSKHESTLDW
jgi:Tol biopolymer transport system component